MATRILEHESNTSKPDDADALEAEAERLRHQRETLLERARDLRADRRQRLRAVTALAEEMGVTERPLVDAIRTGKLIAWRLGGTERGELVTTMANVEAYLATQPAAKAKPVKDAPSADIYSLAVRAARGGR